MKIGALATTVRSFEDQKLTNEMFTNICNGGFDYTYLPPLPICRERSSVFYRYRNVP